MAEKIYMHLDKNRPHSVRIADARLSRQTNELADKIKPFVQDENFCRASVKTRRLFFLKCLELMTKHYEDKNYLNSIKEVLVLNGLSPENVDFIFEIGDHTRSTPEIFYSLFIRDMLNFLKIDTEEYEAPLQKSIYQSFFPSSTKGFENVDFQHIKLNQHLFNEIYQSHKHSKNFAGFDFSGLNLSYFDFSGMNLSGAVFDDTQLEKVNFENTILNDAQFINCKIHSSFFNNAQINNTLFQNCLLKKCSFENAIINQCLFQDNVIVDGSQEIKDCNEISEYKTKFKAIPLSVLTNKIFSYLHEEDKLNFIKGASALFDYNTFLELSLKKHFICQSLSLAQMVEIFTSQNEHGALIESSKPFKNRVKFCFDEDDYNLLSQMQLENKIILSNLFYLKAYSLLLSYESASLESHNSHSFTHFNTFQQKNEEFKNFILNHNLNVNHLYHKDETDEHLSPIFFMEEGTCALHIICKTGQFHWLKTLVELGANTNQFSSAGQSALEMCLHAFQFKMFEELLKNKADVNLNLQHNQTILHLLCQDIKLTPSIGSSVLPKISSQNSCQANNFLQAHIRRQNAINNKLEIKTYESYKEQKNKINTLIQLTMVQQANIYLKNEFNETPLDVAVKYGRIETFDYTVSHKFVYAARGAQCT